jgi:hypothetical protein
MGVDKKNPVKRRLHTVELLFLRRIELDRE